MRKYGMEQAAEDSGLWNVYFKEGGQTFWYNKGHFSTEFEEKADLDFFSACRILNTWTNGAVYQTRVDMDVKSADSFL